MDRPHVVVIAIHGGEPVMFGQPVVAGLFEAERVHPLCESVMGMGWVDVRQ